ncbi:MAG TPA: nucleoside triphosphate pyrophosphatase, partial [Rhodocyclaceae bacterium]
MAHPTAQLVLGSSSPFRRELLARLGIPFAVLSPDIDETARASEAPRELALRLAGEKARAVARSHPAGLIIGCDQVAHIGTRVFGKPGTHQNAARQLAELSGQTVVFESALCLLDASTGRMQIDSIPTEITFRTLSAPEIENY